MLFDVISNVANGLMQFFALILPAPDPVVSAWLSSHVDLSSGYLNLLNSASLFFPVETFITAITYIIIMESTMVIIKISIWIIHTLSLGIFKKLN